MARFARWATMIVSTGVVFLVSLWLFRFLSFQWMPHNTADRWVVAAAFATVAASAVAAATAWWAGRDEQSEVPRKEQPQKIGSVGGQEITRSRRSGIRATRRLPRGGFQHSIRGQSAAGVVVER